MKGEGRLGATPRPEAATEVRAVKVPERGFGERGPRTHAPLAAGESAGDSPGDSGAAGGVTTIDLPKGFFPFDEQAICVKDLLLLAALPALAAVAWSCPDSVCLGLARAATRWLHRLRPQRYRDYSEIFRDFLPDASPSRTVDALGVEAAALQHLERLQLLRHHRPGGWRPKIALAGKEHLDRALAQGKGAILWVTFSVFSDMNAKIALREQGYDVSHLSRHIHGHLSSTRFGIRFLNPIRIAVERRYLAERVVIDPANPKAALQRLEALLADNRVVSITAGAMAGRVTLAPFGPGSMPLAGGAPNLSLKSGAPLLPVFTERRPDGSFLVTIEPPPEAPAHLSREQKITDMIVRESALLYRYFVRLPTQFLYPDLHHIRRRCEAVRQAEAKASKAV